MRPGLTAGAGGDAISDQASVEDDVDVALRGGVAGDLLGAEHGFKLADEIGGADDFFAEASAGTRWFRHRPWRRT